MISSPNKNFFPKQSLVSLLDFFTIESSVDITSDTPAAQALLNTIIETIALNGQPVISALVSNTAPVATQFGALGTPYTGTTYSLKFAVEHTGAWTQDTLAMALSAITFDSYTEVTGSDGTTPLATDDVVTTTTVVDTITGVTAPAVPYSGETFGSLATIVAVGSDVTTALPTGLNMVVTYNSL
jgi:hypothetical protein